MLIWHLKERHLLDVGGFSRITKIRGEETFALRKLKEKFGNDLELHCPKCIVYNQFPNSVLEMLRTVYLEGFSYAQIFVISKKTTVELGYRICCFFLLTLAPHFDTD